MLTVEDDGADVVGAAGGWPLSASREVVNVSADSSVGVDVESGCWPARGGDSQLSGSSGLITTMEDVVEVVVELVADDVDGPSASAGSSPSLETRAIAGFVLGRGRRQAAQTTELAMLTTSPGGM